MCGDYVGLDTDEESSAFSKGGEVNWQGSRGGALGSKFHNFVLHIHTYTYLYSPLVSLGCQVF